jgi:hypothetical protein
MFSIFGESQLENIILYMCAQIQDWKKIKMNASILETHQFWSLKTP